MKRKNKIIIACIILLIAFLSIFVIMSFKKRSKELAKCTEIHDWSALATTSIWSCHGVLAVETSDYPDANKYVVRDEELAYTVAGLQDPKAIRDVGEYLYVIDQRVFEYEKNPSNGKFLMRIRTDKESLKIVEGYEAIDFPHYLKINKETGVVTPFFTKNEMNDEDREIFEELEN